MATAVVACLSALLATSTLGSGQSCLSTGSSASCQGLAVGALGASRYEKGAQQAHAHSNLAVVVRSQLGRLHAERVAAMRNTWSFLQGDSLIFTHELGRVGWSPTASLPVVFARLPKATEWVLFIEDDTDVHFDKVASITSSYDPHAHVLLGRALRDAEPTVIHQYNDDPQLVYPDFACGWLASMALIKDVVAHLNSTEARPEFLTDAQFDVAKLFRAAASIFVSNHSDVFCSSPGRNCLTVAHARPNIPRLMNLSLSEISFAVKTASKFHKTRLMHVRQTWGRTVKHIEYISEVADPAIPTVASGVENTDMGHCGKTQFILRRFSKQANFLWYVLADDDTSIRVSRLVRLLSHFDPAEPIILGERYAYGLAMSYGYDYITGGGGIVFSKAAVEAIAKSDCDCWQVDSPDDMWIGSCAAHINIPLVHHSGFHQAPPAAYDPLLLEHQTLISFHKCMKSGDCTHARFGG